MQGVQPSPKTMPSGRAPASPPGTLSARRRRSRYRKPGRITPARNRPMTITSTPATRVTRFRFRTSQDVTAPRAAPRATKTSENPSTNRVAPALDVLAAHPGHVGEVAGDQRQHARGGEGHEPGQGGHGQGDQEVPVDHDLLRPLGPAHLRSPARPGR